jgi:hypothetical protein
MRKKEGIRKLEDGSGKRDDGKRPYSFVLLP